MIGSYKNTIVLWHGIIYLSQDFQFFFFIFINKQSLRVWQIVMALKRIEVFIFSFPQYHSLFSDISLLICLRIFSFFLSFSLISSLCMYGIVDSDDIYEEWKSSRCLERLEHVFISLRIFCGLQLNGKHKNIHNISLTTITSSLHEKILWNCKGKKLAIAGYFLNPLSQRIVIIGKRQN